MANSLFSPITDGKEVESLLKELPIAIDKQHFLNFVLGFPRKYLVSTPRVEIVKHYFLLESLGNKTVISSLSAEKENLWKLSLVTRDRRYLFSRISGSLSYFEMNIVEAQAFANANSLVLDTFQFADPHTHFRLDTHRRNLLHFLEEVLEGKKDIEPLLKARWEEMMPLKMDDFVVKMDNDIHPSATLATLDCHDHYGLLYLVSRTISEENCDIEIAYVQTPGQRVHDEFYITHQGKKLGGEVQERLRKKLEQLGKHYVKTGESSQDLRKGL